MGLAELTPGHPQHPDDAVPFRRPAAHWEYLLAGLEDGKTQLNLVLLTFRVPISPLLCLHHHSDKSWG